MEFVYDRTLIGMTLEGFVVGERGLKKGRRKRVGNHTSFVTKETLVPFCVKLLSKTSANLDHRGGHGEITARHTAASGMKMEEFAVREFQNGI